ncbi:ubiquinone/menaquinone biosynthesis C-methylase UbiE [Dyadobacter sp. BE34]|uniref:Ubiquinone/menaquinone biosynthesis C-methylase UbiE n=1 Tax=Dyadobacter fermentans TaxID=94254 RepID=A0ABU1R3M0_9BACT|nr:MULTISPECIES: class I SAM-dependent methyltransferase [Dyadobacter]MDR6808008.1 ubiquinone/menaquinone biosynthesis C-methylase UbiE [Dyadobacter fermentans]MDR7046176.1 ubiquinone/menaquinone biosynthesis C-methylase UbiE [Dyadobacter sp. BE242]MDR7200489.1 ubiquinone/menaquinone biosynthesis C-methylase UbiE [Dyadobacter sp. BE34]MDR7218449.1 ubiquinone/menaquinone biosynthesis C-methylase UbiE [Dyadobacter sp. BE31]MDR7266380.1 ubiquinone/menaquinone biosynthesis C-methylase UbiE [Dyadob
MLNNYDRIATNYDRLSRLIFGKSIVRAQQALLPFIGSPARILIVGGGTGWILEEIARLSPSGLAIDYVEISSKMLDLARRRNCRENHVAFVHAGIENYAAPVKYDVVMTPFLFDNFSRERAHEVFDKLDKMLKNGALWLFADFHIDQNLNRIWQKALLRSMYIFFKNISHVEADQLPDMHTLFNTHNYHLTFETFHFGRFIRSAAYRKSGNGGTATTENKPLVENDNR